MNAFDMSPRDFQIYLDERGYTGDQRDDLLRRYRRANSPFAGIFDFIEGLRGGDEEAGLRRGEIAPMVFPEGMSGFEAFTTGQARPAVPGFLLGGAEAAASAVDAPSAAAAGLIPAQDAAMEALGTAGFAMGAGGAAVRPAGSVGAGGRVADALPAPRNEAEAMAKQVLEMCAAGRAGDVTEEMMAAADPQYMFAHTPLPMDEASRMARREAMYGKDRYHGSNMDFQGFFGNVFTSDNPTVASTYNRGMLDAQIYPVVTRGGPLGEVTVEGGLSNWNQLRPDMIDDQSIARALDLGMPISTRDIERQAVLEGRSGVTFKDINDLGPGFNSQQFKNLGLAPEEAEALRLKYLEELAPSEVDVRLSPNLVRSRFARFDPEFAHLRNLSAANADKSTGLLAAASSGNFEDYLRRVNPQGLRVDANDRPNLMMGDMYGMLPRNARKVSEREGVSFYQAPDGAAYATAFNPDVGEMDVVGYAMPRGDMTDLAVVGEMQGRGIGSELQYLMRSQDPYALTGGLTEAGEASLRRTYNRLRDEGIIAANADKSTGLLAAAATDRQFDVTRRDASSIFGQGAERVRYTDPQSGGTMEVVVRPDGSASVLELEVPEASRGQGIGQSLQERVLRDYPVMGGQVSSKAAATTAYRLGRRPYGQPDATLKDVFRMIDENSSVNLVSPQAQPTPRTPGLLVQ